MINSDALEHITYDSNRQMVRVGKLYLILQQFCHHGCCRGQSLCRDFNSSTHWTKYFAKTFSLL